MPGDNPDSQPLPKGWVRTFSNSQKRYYYSHKDTKHTQWHFPTVSEVADPWMAKARSEANQKKEKDRGSSTKKRKDESEEGSSKRPRPSSEKHVSSSSHTKPVPAPASSAIDSLLSLADTTSVAIIVPYRDLHVEQKRAAHLAKFVPHMIQFLGSLQKQGKVSDFHVYIVEQSDDGRKFNRGKLLNIGFDYAKKQKGLNHDVFIFHDVDLLPQADLGAAYATFPKTPYHIARVWDRYSNNPKYFGGVVSFSSSDFKRINGYPNTFWGWGGEDDELQNRCQAIGLKWDWPRTGGTLVDLEQMTLQEKLNFLRNHKEWKCMVKWEALEEHATTWKTNGLVDLNYKILGTKPLDGKPAGQSKATLLSVDVKLNGNHWANDKCSVDFMGDWKK
eukprot:Nitzschia sp. Nitz4//scaffold315_size20666//6259//7425//NITZ4_008642-RA/size20666-processed-gene-0.3-mRNA-1//-1//CDS//3329547489//6894//frame0